MRKSRAIGTAASEPEPPSATKTAKARSPCQPTNQAWVASEPSWYSALPVLP